MLPSTQSLHFRLLDAEERSLSLIVQDISVMRDFQEDWSRLGTELAEAIERQSVDEATISVAHRVAARVQILASRFISFYDDIDEITSSFQRELDSMFSDLAIVEAPTSSTSLTSRKPTLPPYIETAHNWLMENLHNPYPSKETRSLLSQRSGATCKDIDTWFINVRKRIGWNDLRLREFSNKRSLIVAAATQFFKSPNWETNDKRIVNNCSVSSASARDFSSHFMTIYQRADNLYSRHAFSVPEVSRSSIKPRVHCTKSFEGESTPQSLLSVRNNFSSDSVLSYPSPQPSQASSPEPSSPQTSYAICNPRKRKNTSLFLDDDTPSNQEQSLKRLRLQRLEIDPALSLPSPPASESELSTPCLELRDTPNSEASTLPGKRKRRLSDAECYPSRKRPHVFGFPQVHSVSDPLSLKVPLLDDVTVDLERSPDSPTYVNGYDFSCKMPPPVSTCGVDDIDEVNIDFFRYDFSQQTELSPLQLSSSGLPAPSPTLELPTYVGNFSLNDSIFPNDLQGVDVLDLQYDSFFANSQPDMMPSNLDDFSCSIFSCDDLIAYLELLKDYNTSERNSNVISHFPLHPILHGSKVEPPPYLECTAF